ncbi:MAG: hypothetical protein HY909_08675 [Deltaproteobacteria bacterium]|nr:hypothetical protein [Deltaproteobacteria bacterium]
MATHTPAPASLAALAFALLALLGAPWPDDWDAVGFVLAVDHFDLARWQPHAPGYPGYVLAARALRHLGAAPVTACTLVSALGASLLVASLAPRHRLSGLLPLASPLVLLAATSARSDALGLGLHALALSRAPGPLTGALLAAGLATRPSLLPLTVTLLLAKCLRPGERARTLGAFALVGAFGALWLLRAARGLEPLTLALETQARGHFTLWGGSALTHPSLPLRARWLLGALMADGLGIHRSPIGALRALAWAGILGLGLWRAPRRALLLAALLVPYGVWVFAGQNLETSPRHVLPLLGWALWVGTEGLSVPTGRWRWLAGGLLAGLVLTALPGAWRRRVEPPPAVQASRWVEARGGGVVFGGASTRVLSWAGTRALPRTRVGEVDVTLERLDVLPRRVWLTDEVAFRERGRGALGPPVRFCRGAESPCLRLFPYTIPIPRDH